VVVPTCSGATARAIARFRLPVWIAAPTNSAKVLRDLQFTYGIEPVSVSELPGEWTTFTSGWVSAEALPGRVALLIQGPSAGSPHANHRMEIQQLH
jgi:pyruvate kinase